ncbi:unnamed protein product [Choristocarpus tenellus]
MCRESLTSQSNTIPSRTGKMPKHIGEFLLQFIWILVVLAMTMPLSIMGADPARLIRCDSEDDLDGVNCRADMLSDEALAEMVMARGFDPTGSDRPTLLDAVIEILEYEKAHGVDLREEYYVPEVEPMRKDGSMQEHGVGTTDEVAGSSGEGGEEDRGSGVEVDGVRFIDDMVGTESELADQKDFALGTESAETVIAVPHDQEGGNDQVGDADVLSGGVTEKDDENADSAAREAILEGTEEAAAATASTIAPDSDVGPSPSGNGIVVARQTDTIIGYVLDIGEEILAQMRRDLVFLVDLLPEPVATPVKRATSFVADTVCSVGGPVLNSAERYTRGLRRGAGEVAGKVVGSFRDEVAPRALEKTSEVFTGIGSRIRQAVAGGKRQDAEGDKAQMGGEQQLAQG